MDDTTPETIMSRRGFIKAGTALMSIALLPVTLLLGACAQQPLLSPIPVPDFSDLAPLNFAVAQIEVENIYDNRAAYPHTEALSPHPPVQIIEHWVSQTMRPEGVGAGGGLLTVRIVDASIIEEKLPRSPGLSGLFRIEQSEAYHGHILLEIRAVFQDFQGEMSIESQASQTVDENTSLRQRQQVWVDLGDKMVRDIDRTLRESLTAELPRLLLAQ